MKFLNFKLGASDLFYGVSGMASLVAARLNIKGNINTFLRKCREQQVLTNAVVGFVDIVSSTAISNTLDIQKDFRFRKAFQDLAARRARQNGITILNDTGDGLLFLVNSEGDIDWGINLVRFCEGLTADFIKLESEFNLEIQSGLRFGITSGSVIVASLRGNESQMAAVGSSVNLAARLCAKAEPNEAVFSQKIWQAVAGTLSSHQRVNRVHTDIKGFANEISATHVETAH